MSIEISLKEELFNFETESLAAFHGHFSGWPRPDVPLNPLL